MFGEREGEGAFFAFLDRWDLPVYVATDNSETQRRFAEGKLAAASNWPLAEAGEGAKLREKTVSFATAQAEAARTAKS